jgi:hypothetical protein
MIHWRVSYTKDDWFHIIAASDNKYIGDAPNGSAKIFSKSDDTKGPNEFITVFGNDPDGYTADENGAMQKVIDMLTKEYGYPPVSILRL